MAGLDCVVNSGTQSLSSDTEETVLQLKAATNQRVKIKGYSLTMGGIVVKDLIMKVLIQTDAGTAATTPYIEKITPGATETIQTGAKANF